MFLMITTDGSLIPRKINWFGSGSLTKTVQAIDSSSL